MASHTNQEKVDTKSSVIRQLRALMPQRLVSTGHAKRIAEKQATLLRKLVDNPEPVFELSAVADLPRIKVSRDKDLSTSGATKWRNGAWHITIRSVEPPLRQRFTLAHEFKHIIDAPYIKAAYGFLDGRLDKDQQIEAICDQFAGCLLMPRSFLDYLWHTRGIRRLDELAGAFDVSTMAMKRRLMNLGYIDSNTCETDLNTGTQHLYICARSPRYRTYYRVRSLHEPEVSGVAA